MARQAATIARTRHQVGEWASEHHPDEFRELMMHFVGAERGILHQRPDLVEQALNFAIVATTTAGDTLTERYIALGLSHPRAIRDTLRTLQTRRFTAMHVVDVAPDRGLHIRDLIADERLFLREVSATHQLQPEDWLIGSIGKVDGGWELLGDVRIIPPVSTIRVVQALLLPDQPEVAAVTAYHRGLLPPRLENCDGDLIELIELVLDLSWEDMQTRAASWSDVDVSPDAIALLSNSVLGLGIASRAMFEPHEDGVVVSVNSLQREQMVLERLGGPKVLERISHAHALPPNDPKGDPMVFDNFQADVPEGVDAQAYLDDVYMSGWADEPIPAIDGLTPRQAVAAGRVAEVRALAPEGTEALAGLGLEP